MGTDVPSLVVSMDGEVQPHQLCELRVLVAQHGGEVGGPILLRVYAANLVHTHAHTHRKWETMKAD